MHGGAFIMGDKRAPLISKFANDLAKKGYVVASIDYRPGFNPGSKSSLERSAYRAVQDSRAALRYLSHFQVIYRINPDYCFIGGSSAGAITALNTAITAMPTISSRSATTTPFLRWTLRGQALWSAKCLAPNIST